MRRFESGSCCPCSMPCGYPCRVEQATAQFRLRPSTRTSQGRWNCAVACSTLQSMNVYLPTLIQIAGGVQLSILIASALVPLRLDWKESLGSLPRLHRQLYWVYGGYVVLAIMSLG